MAAKPVPLTQRAAWKALGEHYQNIRNVHLRSLFADDPKRGERFAVEGAGLYLDYSKHRISEETMRLLLALAEESGLARADRSDVLAARKSTSPRIARSCTWRCAPRAAPSIMVDGENVVPKVHEVLDRMAAFARRVRDGQWKGHTGKRIRNVINIGIGGSDLGPVMAYEALRHYADPSLNLRFVSNVDGTDFVVATTRARSRRDPVYRFVQDLHHA